MRDQIGPSRSLSGLLPLIGKSATRSAAGRRQIGLRPEPPMVICASWVAPLYRAQPARSAALTTFASTLPRFSARCGGRKNSRGFPASRANAVGLPACSPPDTPVRNSISAGRRYVDRGQIADDNTDIDVVELLSLGRVLLDRIMPTSSPSPDRLRAPSAIPNGVITIIDAGTAS